MNYAPLYKTDSKGKTRVWNIAVNDDSYTVTHGLIDGKQITETTTSTAKNVGRSNETTPQQQAIIEATALHTKQLERQGYTLEIGETVNYIRPMLARDYKNVPHQIKDDDDLLLSPKLDGVRAIWIPEKGKFQSRKGTFYNVPHLEQALKDCNVMLDGEIYLHGTPLNRINGAVRKANDLTPQLQFHVFDVVDTTLKTRERLELIKTLDYLIGVVIVEQIAGKKADIKPLHDQFVNDGFEGVMIRRNGVYLQGVRPDSLYKYKEFFDDEFLVIGVEIDKDGGGTLQCKGFNVRMCGTDSDRKHIADNPHDYIGQLVTVRYFTLTEYGVPQFPVGVCIRTDK